MLSCFILIFYYFNYNNKITNDDVDCPLKKNNDKYIIFMLNVIYVLK